MRCGTLAAPALLVFAIALSCLDVSLSLAVGTDSNRVLLIHNTFSSPHVPVHRRLVDISRELIRSNHSVSVLTTQGCFSGTFFAELSALGAEPICDAIERIGTADGGAGRAFGSDLELPSFLKTRNFKWIGIYLWFWGSGMPSAPEQYFHSIRTHAPHAQIVVFTDDVHHLRAQRISDAAGGPDNGLSVLAARHFPQHVVSHEPLHVLERESWVYEHCADIVVLATDADQRVFRHKWPNVSSTVLHFGHSLLQPSWPTRNNAQQSNTNPSTILDPPLQSYAASTRMRTTSSRSATSDSALRAACHSNQTDKGKIESGFVFIGNPSNVANALGLEWFFSKVWPIVQQLAQEDDLLSATPIYLVGVDKCLSCAQSPGDLPCNASSTACLFNTLLQLHDLREDTGEGFSDPAQIVAMGRLSNEELMQLLLPAADDRQLIPRILVAPVIAGTGINTKNLLGLQAGVPVLTTSMGAVGMSLSHDFVETETCGETASEFLAVADTPIAFANAMQQLLRDADRRGRMTTAGKAHALKLASLFSRDVVSLQEKINHLTASGREPAQVPNSTVCPDLVNGCHSRPGIRLGQDGHFSKWAWSDNRRQAAHKDCRFEHMCDTISQASIPAFLSVALETTSERFAHRDDELKFECSSEASIAAWTEAINAVLGLDSTWPLTAASISSGRHKSMQFYIEASALYPSLTSLPLNAANVAALQEVAALYPFHLKFTNAGLVRAAAAQQLQAERGYRVTASVSVPTTEDLLSYLLHFSRIPARQVAEPHRDPRYNPGRKFVESICSESSDIAAGPPDPAVNWQRVDTSDFENHRVPSYIVSRSGARCFVARALTKLLLSGHGSAQILNPFWRSSITLTEEVALQSQVNPAAIQKVWHSVLNHSSCIVASMGRSLQTHILKFKRQYEAMDHSSVSFRSSTARFVVLAHARVGSNALIATLNQHPNITAHYELFHPSHIYAVPMTAAGDRYNMDLRNYNLTDRNRYPADFLCQVWRCSSGPGESAIEIRDHHNGEATRDGETNATPSSPPPATAAPAAVGFKVLAGQLPFGTLDWLLLRDCEVHKIVLVRENALDVYVSLMKAAAAGAWGSVQTTDMPVHVDLGDFLDFESKYWGWYARLVEALAGQKVLLVFYKSLVCQEGHPGTSKPTPQSQDPATQPCGVRQQNLLERIEAELGVKPFFGKQGNAPPGSTDNVGSGNCEGNCGMLSSVFVKQDRSRGLPGKISNFQSLQQAAQGTPAERYFSMTSF